MTLVKRKPNRLQSYDYSQSGAYFLTVCTKDMKCVLWKACTSSLDLLNNISHLSAYGFAIDSAIREIPLHYPGVTVEKYAVMPNHLHMILLLAGKHTEHRPDISRIVQQMKSAVTKSMGKSIWQKSFHDHIIREEKEYLAIWEYIHNNPVRWREDCYYKDAVSIDTAMDTDGEMI